MANENKENIDSTKDDKDLEIDLNIEDKGGDDDSPKPSDKKEEKPTETLEARRARLMRQLDQTNKKLGLDTEKKAEPSSNSNDLVEKTFLIANGIKTADEIALARKIAKETGKDVESLLESTYFQTELKDFRDKKATDNATPTGNNRSNNSSVDTVEYWIAKGELPPKSEVKLRQDVVNARIKKESSGGVFYNS